MAEKFFYKPSMIKEKAVEGDLVRSISIPTESGFLHVTGRFLAKPLNIGYENRIPSVAQYSCTFSGDSESVLSVVESLRMKILGVPNPDVVVNNAIMHDRRTVRYPDEDFDRTSMLSEEELNERKMIASDDFHSFIELLGQTPDGAVITDGWSEYRFILQQRRDKVAITVTSRDLHQPDDDYNRDELGINYNIWARDINLRIDPRFCDDYDDPLIGESLKIKYIYE